LSTKFIIYIAVFHNF